MCSLQKFLIGLTVISNIAIAEVPSFRSLELGTPMEKIIDGSLPVFEKNYLPAPKYHTPTCLTGRDDNGSAVLDMLTKPLEDCSVGTYWLSSQGPQSIKDIDGLRWSWGRYEFVDGTLTKFSMSYHVKLKKWFGKSEEQKTAERLIKQFQSKWKELPAKYSVKAMIVDHNPGYKELIFELQDNSYDEVVKKRNEALNKKETEAGDARRAKKQAEKEEFSL